MNGEKVYEAQLLLEGACVAMLSEIQPPAKASDALKMAYRKMAVALAILQTENFKKEYGHGR